MLLKVLLSAAAAWVVAVVAAPVLGAPVIYEAAALVCHQIPERTFHLSAGPLAVCARCLGLYVGGVAGLVAGARAGILRRAGGPSIGAAAARRIVLLSAVPTALTLAAEWLLAWPPGNVTRFLAALPLGGGAAFVVAAAMAAERQRSVLVR